MKLRVHLKGTIEVDVQHPTFIELLDPREVEDLGDGVVAPKHHNDTRTWMALEGYLEMLIAGRRREGVEPRWEVEQVETFCRICGCTGDVACEGGCSWVEPDLCSAHQEAAV